MSPFSTEDFALPLLASFKTLVPLDVFFMTPGGVLRRGSLVAGGVHAAAAVGISALGKVRREGGAQPGGAQPVPTGFGEWPCRNCRATKRQPTRGWSYRCGVPRGSGNSGGASAPTSSRSVKLREDVWWCVELLCGHRSPVNKKL